MRSERVGNRDGRVFPSGGCTLVRVYTNSAHEHFNDLAHNDAVLSLFNFFQSGL